MLSIISFVFCGILDIPKSTREIYIWMGWLWTRGKENNHNPVVCVCVCVCVGEGKGQGDTVHLQLHVLQYIVLFSFCFFPFVFFC